MIFETELDNAGNPSVKQLPCSLEPCNAIKRDLFQKLSPSQKKDLTVINHFFKKNLYSSLLNLDKPLEIIKSEEFDAVDFKSLFEGVFAPILDLFKDIFFINEKGELINRYEGYVLKIDAQTQKIHFEKIPEYEILWEQTERKLKSRLLPDDVFNLEEYINVMHLDILGIDLKRQFLAYTGEVFKTDKYTINQHIVVEKMFNHLNKDGYLNIDNLSDFKRDFEFIKKNYYNNRHFRAGVEYILDDKELSVLNDCNIFDFFNKRMSSLFYHQREPVSLMENDESYMPVTHHVEKPELDEIINPEYVDEISKVVNAYMHIEYNISRKYALYSRDMSRKYLYSEDRGFRKDKPAHRIHNLSYIEFLNYYKLNDDTMSLCFYHYMFEFSLIDKKIDDYINEMIFDFTNNHEKARVLLSGEGDTITVTNFNKNIELPLHILNNLFNKNKEEESLFKIFFSIYEGKVPVEYNNTHEDMKKLFSYASAHNKNNLLCEELEKLGYFNSSLNIINFIGCVKELFEEKGELLSSKVDLDGCIGRRLKKELNSLEEIRNRLRGINNGDNVKKERNRNDDEWVDFIDEKLFKLLTGDGLIASQEEIINNFIWVEKEFNLYTGKVVCSLRRTPCFDEEKNWRSVGMTFKEIIKGTIQVIDLLDYHLLKGHNDVVYYLRSKGFYPCKKEEGLTPLDYALIGVCDNDIIDWICESIEVKPFDEMNVFGFLRVPLFPANINNKLIYDTLLNDFETKSFFNYDILNDENPDMKLDSAVLEKMSYVYKKHKVNFNNNSERIYHLLNKENRSFFINDLNLNSNNIEKIKYSLLIKDLVCNREIDLLKEEIKTSRLTIDMNLMHNIIIKDNKESSGILNLLYLNFKYSNQQKDIDFIYDLVTSLLDNMNNETKKNLHNIKDFEGLNVFEIIMSLGVHEHRRLIKKLVIDYDFNLKSGVFVFNEVAKEEDFKTYKEIYFSNNVYLENLYIYFSTQFEKEKIEKVINSVDVKKADRKRM